LFDESEKKIKTFAARKHHRKNADRKGREGDRTGT